MYTNTEPVDTTQLRKQLDYNVDLASDAAHAVGGYDRLGSAYVGGRIEYIESGDLKTTPNLTVYHGFPGSVQPRIAAHMQTQPNKIGGNWAEYSVDPFARRAADGSPLEFGKATVRRFDSEGNLVHSKESEAADVVAGLASLIATHVTRHNEAMLQERQAS